jgi:hypothetical protein
MHEMIGSFASVLLISATTTGVEANVLPNAIEPELSDPLVTVELIATTSLDEIAAARLETSLSVVPSSTPR